MVIYIYLTQTMLIYCVNNDFMTLLMLCLQLWSLQQR